MMDNIAIVCLFVIGVSMTVLVVSAAAHMVWEMWFND